MTRFEPQRKIKIKWSSNFAYAIGLIASDGNLSTDGRHINLKSADKEIIQNFKKALNLRNNIRSTKKIDKPNKHSYIQFGDIIFYKFLNNLGFEFFNTNAFFPERGE